MVDFNCCDHECACQHNGHLEAAQQYSSILSKVMSKNADSEYVSKEDKDNWNSKANKDLVDLIKVMVEKHEERLDDLEDGLDKKIKLILYDLGFGDNLLAKYATIEYVNDLIAKLKNDEIDLSKYALKSDLDSIKNDIQNKIDKLTTEITNIKINGGKDYSIESMTYDGEYLVLRQKNGGQFTVSIASGPNPDISGFVTKSQLASELTKYAEKNKLKRIRVKGEVHSLYGDGTEIIDIPTGSGEGGNDGKDGGYYKQYFKNNTSDTVAPERPTNGSAPSAASGWTENAVNRKPGEYTWMIQVFVSGDGLYGQYMAPICITGSKGDQGPQGPAGSSGTGADTNDKDFCYYRTTKGQDIKDVQKPDGDNYYDWTDNPQGVGYDKETGVFYDNEWMCVRVKTNGVWGKWIGPVLWSHYGENGTDGDGIEYIFTKTSTGAPIENPSSWYTNEQSKANGKDDDGKCSWENDPGKAYYNNKYYNQDEYIKLNSGWFDDPSNIKDQHPGDKIWVSVRKKRNDTDPTSSEKEDAYWHQYSSPKIWSYYAKDGLVDAVIIDVVGETRYVYIDPATKLSKQYNANVTVNMYNSGDPISKTLAFESFKKSDGTDMSSLKSSFDFSNNNSVAINFADNALDFSNNAYYILTLTGTPGGSVSSQKRYAEISFYGISNYGIQGANGVSVGIYTTASVISEQDGSLYPNEIGALVRWGEGKTLTEYTPENPGGWQFSYMVDDNDWTEMTSNTIQSQGKMGISFKAHKDDINLQEYVPIVKSGIPGLNGVSYKIEVSDMSLSYKANQNSKYNISSTFIAKLYKKEGNADYTLQKTAGYNCNISTNPSIEVTSPTKSDDQWACSVSGEVSSSSATIQIFINNSNDAFVDSITIPISAAGKDGDAATGQTIKGRPLRMMGDYDKKNAPYLDGKRASDEDGVFYQDIVLWENVYYACINTQAGIDAGWSENPGTASYWQKFSVTPDFVADKIIANQAYIKELSSEEVVLFDGEEIVAGMTSGRNLNNSKLDPNTTKGDIRIWAGKFEGGNLNKAPFTVTNTGVLTCQNTKTKDSITLKDGTIYFNVNGTTYHLGVTNGKPDWIGGIDSIQLFTFSNTEADKVDSINQTVLYISDGKYYNNSQLTSLANGTFYIWKAMSDTFDIGNNKCLIQAATTNVYEQIKFTNGNVSSSTLCAIGPKITYVAQLSGGRLQKTEGNYFYKIAEKDYDDLSFYTASGSLNEDINSIDKSNITFFVDNNMVYLLTLSNVGDVLLENSYSYSSKGEMDDKYTVRSVDVQLHLIPINVA